MPGSARRAPLVLPVIPAVALLVSPWLPFVNTSHLWFGLPGLFVWTSIWVMAFTPALIIVNRLWARPTEAAAEGEQP